jgi:dimethylaniline monooxygenase (N-oxide forming)
MRVAIIGGGPSGLVTLKTLITAHEFLPDTKPIEAMLFEAEGSVGGTFKYRAYEDAEVSCGAFDAAFKRSVCCGKSATS